MARNGPPAMSAVWSLSGGKRTWRLPAPTSEFDPFRTLDEPLFDHLIGRREEGRRHGEAKGLGGPEIDDELEVSRLLNRKIGRLCSFENLPAIDTNLTIDRGEQRTQTSKPPPTPHTHPPLNHPN